MDNELLNNESLGDKNMIHEFNGEAPAPESVKPGKSRRKIVIIVGTIIVIAALLFYFRGAFVAAMVNGSFISRASLDRELEKASGKQILDGLVTKKLVEESVKGINVSKEEVDAAKKTIEDQLQSQNMTLDSALKARGMSMQDFTNQITIQTKLQKLFADKVQVTPEEIAKFIKDSKLTVPKGSKPEDFNVQVAAQLKQQKFSQEVTKLVADLKAKAKITYFLNF